VENKDKNKKVREAAFAKGLSKKAAAAMASVPLPPIRNKVDIQNRLKAGKASDIFGKDELQKNTQKLKEDQAKGQGKEEKVLKRDITPMFDYYKAWDNFADKAVADAENGDEDATATDFIPATNPKPVDERAPQTQAEMMQRTSGAKPNTKLVIKGGTVKKNG